MSVLIGMLQDLDRRGQAPRVDPGIASAIERAVEPQPIPSSASRRRAVVLVVAAILLAASAFVLLRPGRIPGPPAPAEPRPIVQAAPPAPAPVRAVASPSQTVAVIVPAAMRPSSARASGAAPDPTHATVSAATRAAVLATTHAAAPAAEPAAAPAAPPGGGAPAAGLASASLAEAGASIVLRKTGAFEDAPELARAYELAQRGRSVEAIALLRQGLAASPAHHESRRALAALLAERDQRSEACDVLLEGARLDPTRFALEAARLQAELGHFSSALATAGLVPESGRDAQYHAQAGAIAQRAGRHDLAVEEFRSALAGGAPRALWWVALGSSLEQVDRRPDALAAYRQALQMGGASQSVRDYAGGRVAALAVPLGRDAMAPRAVAAIP